MPFICSSENNFPLVEFCMEKPKFNFSFFMTTIAIGSEMMDFFSLWKIPTTKNNTNKLVHFLFSFHLSQILWCSCRYVFCDSNLCKAHFLCNENIYLHFSSTTFELLELWSMRRVEFIVLNLDKIFDGSMLGLSDIYFQQTLHLFLSMKGYCLGWSRKVLHWESVIQALMSMFLWGKLALTMTE